MKLLFSFILYESMIPLSVSQFGDFIKINRPRVEILLYYQSY